MNVRAATDANSVPLLRRTLVQTPAPALHAAPHHRVFEALGAHLDTRDGKAGTAFCVWAPNARQVDVVGDFNGWSGQPMHSHNDGSGRWSAFIPGAAEGNCYKYRITPQQGMAFEKADPVAFAAELPPRTASRIASLEYRWNDGDWMAARARRQAMDQPMSVYEVHLGSWQRAEDGSFLDYREIGHRLAAHCEAMGFTHVELMPVAEHPFYGSWGYQITGYFAPSSRYGSPQDLMCLVDTLHQRGFGVLLDWVPSHFPSDAHSLGAFDGTHLYEHADPRLGFHPQWNSLIFNYGRYEVRDFLIANALFWLQYYHFDGLRVDAVASMLYLDFAREDGQWLPNEHGGNENLPAVAFMRELNTAVYRAFPDIHMIAEESSSWANVSRPIEMGGLGFGMKWNMGWMNDTLRYVERPHFYREYHQDELKFSFWYAFNENFMLPLSHDEVVYGKGSLFEKQPGDDWQRAAGLRNLFGFMWGHPGKKMLFMGGEFGQVQEWHHERTLDWHLWAQPQHAGIARWVADLNRAYRGLPALHRHDFDAKGFSWASLEHEQRTVLAFWRHAGHADGNVLVLCNFTAAPIEGLRIGVKGEGHWREVLNSDASVYGGSGMGNLGNVWAEPQPCGGCSHRLTVTLPPLAVVFLSDRPIPASH
ncbi:1,4-alpha-glucan branching protein GlgB [Xylophilus rhododendri]|uniref:1,4-alpha-glucan branching enzyme GlgB n=1 Tax=Xylophilus rhododendri TaxID=2697032 RepID=A0A857J0H9_9BURK|nr:1,4-alpha-glucan branching protein GlgB [Xylophilus rhododendri]QHI97360.1 1,4-alpha-glucan branching protein GlgB [Xylophilus rhododendri]